MLLPVWFYASSWLAIGVMLIAVPGLAILTIGNPDASPLSYAVLGLGIYAAAGIAAMLAWHHRSLSRAPPAAVARQGPTA